MLAAPSRHRSVPDAVYQLLQAWAAKAGLMQVEHTQAESTERAHFGTLLIGVIVLMICMISLGSFASNRSHFAPFELANSISGSRLPPNDVLPEMPVRSVKGTRSGSVCSIGPPRFTPSLTVGHTAPTLPAVDAAGSTEALAVTFQPKETTARQAIAAPGQEPEAHFIGTPAPSLPGPPHYMGTPIPSNPLTAPPTPQPSVANPKRFCPQLCPGLVVPRGSECVLAVQPVPLQAPRQDASHASVEILDLCGKPVLKAQVARPLLWCQVDGGDMTSSWGSSRPPAVTLRMLQPIPGPGLLGPGRDSSILTVCRAGETSDARRQMLVYDAAGKLFGRLVKDPTRPRYVLSSNRGECRINFDGIFSDHAVLITNDRQEQLADAEPCSMAFNPHRKFYRLRVASGVDVGLMICGLVAIDEMEAPAA